MDYNFPNDKRYNSFVGYFKQKYGERLQKIVLDAGFTCPNRDGKVGRGGCTYCDNAAFHPAYSTAGKSLHQQMDEGIEFHKVRYRTTEHYLAYFQSFSNTYAPLERLRELYVEALQHPAVVGIVIGTRPDCVDEEKLDFLADLAGGKAMQGWTRTLEGPDGQGSERHAPVVIVEYGIESCYDVTLNRINRGHDFETARRAVMATAERGLDMGAHFILGLPGESRQMMLESCQMINELPIRSAKFHQLQIVKGTRMEKEFAALRRRSTTSFRELNPLGPHPQCRTPPPSRQPPPGTRHLARPAYLIYLQISSSGNFVRIDSCRVESVYFLYSSRARFILCSGVMWNVYSDDKCDKSHGVPKKMVIFAKFLLRDADIC